MTGPLLAWRDSGEGHRQAVGDSRKEVPMARSRTATQDPLEVPAPRSAGGGARLMVRLPGGIELEASRGATPKLKERLGLE